MIENLLLFSREEKLEKLRERIIKHHVEYLTYAVNHSDIHWNLVNPILEKIVDYISEISDTPTFEKLTISHGALTKKAYSVGTFDVTTSENLNSFIENSVDQDIIFYSLMELDGNIPKRMMFRGVIYKSPERVKRENRDSKIDEIVG